MAYPNYSMYQPPITYPTYPTPTVPQTQPTQPVSTSSIVWVQGEGGAKAYPVAAGSSIVLFDSETERFYIKTTDQSGMPQPLRIFDYVERSESDVNNVLDTSNFVTRDEFERAIAKLKKPATPKGGSTNAKPLIRRTADDEE